MDKSIESDNLYLGLKPVLGSFAKFVIIYETEIRHIGRISDFSDRFPKSHAKFMKMQCMMKYVKEPEVQKTEPHAKYTLFFTKHSIQVVDFCRHLRNSFVHVRIKVVDGNYEINDFKSSKSQTAKSFLRKKVVNEFLEEIRKDYEERKMVEEKGN